jgi:ankyrin repeat protein
MVQNGRPGLTWMYHRCYFTYGSAIKLTCVCVPVAGQAVVDQTDANGNTALLFAARVGNVATMRVLIGHGASIDCKNKVGESVWDYAIRKEDDQFLKAVAALYRKAKRLVSFNLIYFWCSEI